MTDLTILGIDALDYDLINEFNNVHIKQTWCSRLKVPKVEGKSPNSAQVWASFLTGYDVGPQSMGEQYRFKTLYTVMKDFKKFFGLKKSFGIGRKIFPMQKARTFLPNHYGTFLDYEEVEFFNAPGYDFENTSFDLCYKWSSNQIDMKELRIRLRELLDNRLKTVLQKTKNRKSKVFFAYIHALDSLQHTALVPSQIKEDYLMIDAVIRIMSRNVKDLIILSDHGYDFDINGHSMQGFISSNISGMPENILELRRYVEEKYLM